MSRRTSEYFKDWLNEELEFIKRRLGLLEEKTSINSHEFQVDEMTLSFLIDTTVE